MPVKSPSFIALAVLQITLGAGSQIAKVAGEIDSRLRAVEFRPGLRAGAC